MKPVSVGLTLALGPRLFLAGCNKAASGAAEAFPGGPAPRADRTAVKRTADAILTKEDITVVLGQPVTTIQGKRTRLTCKAGVLQLEASVEVEQKDEVADAVQSMQGARTATGFLGGKPEAVPGFGDEALLGAMSTLYLRKAEPIAAKVLEKL